MSTRLQRPLLVFSLLANAALAGGLLLSHDGGGAVVATPNPASGTAGGRAVSAHAPGHGNASSASAREAEEALSWTTLTAGSLDAFVAALRSAGWPETTIRRLAAEEIERRNPPLADAAETGEAVEFWHCGAEAAGPFEGMLSEAEAVRARQRREANATEFRRLFGEGPLEGSSMAGLPGVGAGALRDWGRIPEAKRPQVIRILADAAKLRQQVFTEAGGTLLPGDRAVLALIDREAEADLAALLSPEEYLDYRLRNSPTAERMRAELAGFAPSREEFIAIFEAREAFEREYASPWTDVPASDPARQAAERRRDAAIRTAIGEERFAAYRQATDPEFRRLKTLARRAGASPETVARLYELATAAREGRIAMGPVEAQFVQILGAEAAAGFFNHRG